MLDSSTWDVLLLNCLLFLPVKNVVWFPLYGFFLLLGTESVIINLSHECLRYFLCGCNVCTTMVVSSNPNRSKT